MKTTRWLAVAVFYAERVLGCLITPIETQQRALQKGPMMFDTTSDANQFAGRTTLSSGSATVVISTTVVNSDSLIFHSREGNANVASGTNRVTEVKTISAGGYFTLGTEDGQAIPRDTTLMWEIRRSS